VSAPPPPPAVAQQSPLKTYLTIQTRRRNDGVYRCSKGPINTKGEGVPANKIKETIPPNVVARPCVTIVCTIERMTRRRALGRIRPRMAQVLRKVLHKIRTSHIKRMYFVVTIQFIKSSD
jgi:hypothetical protein